MPQNRDPKPKKIKPKFRGEKWKLVDGSHVIVLEKQGHFVRCVTPEGWIVSHHENVFIQKESAE